MSHSCYRGERPAAAAAVMAALQIMVAPLMAVIAAALQDVKQERLQAVRIA